MRILLVVPEYPPDFGGGIAAYYRELAPRLRQLGAEVEVLRGSAFVNGGSPYEHECVRVATLDTSLYAAWLERFSHFAMFPELRGHLASAFAMHEQVREGEAYDVVEVGDWGMAFVPWMITAKAAVHVEMHGSSGQILLHEAMVGREAEGAMSLWLERIALGEAASVSSPGQANANWWSGAVRKTIDWQLPPVSVRQLDRTSTSAGPSWIAAGRIQAWKGPQVACSAWQSLGESAPLLEWAGRDTIHRRPGNSMSVWLRTQVLGRVEPHNPTDWAAPLGCAHRADPPGESGSRAVDMGRLQSGDRRGHGPGETGCCVRRRRCIFVG